MGSILALRCSADFIAFVTLVDTHLTGSGKPDNAVHTLLDGSEAGLSSGSVFC